MATNLMINDKLLTKAKRVGRFRTKRETVDVALREFVQRRKTPKIVKLFGTVDFRDDWDYRKMRGRP